VSSNDWSDLFYSDKAIPEEALFSLGRQKMQFSQEVPLDNQLLHEIAAMAFLFVKIHLLVNNLSDILTLTLVPSVV